MKKIIATLAVLISICSAHAQRLGTNTDPGLSASNYKHPNKAAYARLRNLDGWASLRATTIQRADNYKQPASKKLVNTAVIPSRPTDKLRKSYKHPAGL